MNYQVLIMSDLICCTRWYKLLLEWYYYDGLYVPMVIKKNIIEMCGVSINLGGLIIYSRSNNTLKSNK